MNRPRLAEPMDVCGILAEQEAHARRVMTDAEEIRYCTAIARQRIEQREPEPLKDENGVAFAAGQSIVTFRELWRHSRVRGVAMSMIIANTRGALVDIGPAFATLVFEGPNPAPYYIRLDELHRAVRVVK